MLHIAPCADTACPSRCRCLRYAPDAPAPLDFERKPGERSCLNLLDPVAELHEPPAEPEQERPRLTLKTDLRTPGQLDTIPAELLAAVGSLGAGRAALTLDGNEARWAALRLGLSEATVERVVVLVRVDEGTQKAERALGWRA